EAEAQPSRDEDIDTDQQEGGDRGAQHGAQHMRPLRGAGDGAQRYIALVILRAQAERQGGEQDQPPDDEINRDERNPAHGQTCSSSTSVPTKSLGCRNSTGLPCAPVFGSPSPSTRAPAAFSR